MIFIILLVLFLILGFFSAQKIEEVIWDISAAISFCCAFFLFFTFIGIFISGTTDYVYLRKERVRIQELVNGIEIVKNSYYKQTSVSLGRLIDGSIENMNQSTNLSKYVSETIVKKAEYNAFLKKCQLYESEFVFSMIADGFCINKKVHDIKPIE